MSFFKTPSWPPDDWDDDNDDEHESGIAPYLGVPIPIVAVVARSDTAAVVLREVVAFRDGFEMTVITHARGTTLRKMHRTGSYGGLRGPGPIGDDFLRVGLKFPDGTKVTNLENPWDVPEDDDVEPSHGLEPGGGGGSGDTSSHKFWVWPLPGDGEMDFVCEWPIAGISDTVFKLDANAITAAGENVAPVWPDKAGKPSHHSSLLWIREQRSQESRPDE